jgi:hypothetical protein
VRNGGTITLYINGEADHSISQSGSMNSGGTGLVVGRLYTGSNANYYNGHMDEIRVLNGSARWEGNFIPPLNPDIP